MQNLTKIHLPFVNNFELLIKGDQFSSITPGENFDIVFRGVSGKFAGSVIMTSVADMVTEDNQFVALDDSVYVVDGVEVEASGDVLAEMVDGGILQIIMFMMETGQMVMDKFSGGVPEPQQEQLTQSEIQTLRQEVREILRYTYADIQIFKKVKAELWELCDKNDPTTSEQYKEYLYISNIVEKQKKIVEKFAKISSKLKKMERV
jgi:hypothetical protein